MGKSRMVDQLAKLVFTIPFNLRSVAENKGMHSPELYMHNHEVRRIQGSHFPLPILESTHISLPKA